MYLNSDFSTAHASITVNASKSLGHEEYNSPGSNVFTEYHVKRQKINGREEKLPFRIGT